MSIFLAPAQTAVYTKLTTDLTVNVYDDVPELPSGMPESSFPYIVIGEDQSIAWDTDDQLGARVITTLHVWSRYSGKKEVKAIQAAIYQSLNRQAPNLAATGFRFVDCLHEFSQVLDQGDGKTRHGICRYRITIEKE